MESFQLDEAEKARVRTLLKEQQNFRLSSMNIRYRSSNLNKDELRQRATIDGYGTEHDKINCSFFVKTGCCRYGDGCSKYHPYPATSQTLLICNMYDGPGLLDFEDGSDLEDVDSEALQAFMNFWTDVVPEFEKFGTILELRVCRNYAGHLRGNVLLMYSTEAEAEAAYNAFSNRFYGGRKLMTLHVSLQPTFITIQNIKSAVCGQFIRGGCERSMECNFMHPFPNPRGIYQGGSFKKRDNAPVRRQGLAATDETVRPPSATSSNLPSSSHYSRRDDRDRGYDRDRGDRDRDRGRYRDDDRERGRDRDNYRHRDSRRDSDRDYDDRRRDDRRDRDSDRYHSSSKRNYSPSRDASPSRRNDRRRDTSSPGRDAPDGRDDFSTLSQGKERGSGSLVEYSPGRDAVDDTNLDKYSPGRDAVPPDSAQYSPGKDAVENKKRGHEDGDDDLSSKRPRHS